MFVLAAVAAVAALLKPTREFCEEYKIGSKATYVHVVRGCSRIRINEHPKNRVVRSQTR